MQRKIFGKSGEAISALGLGCMRFPQTNDHIDRAAAQAIIDLAIERGINYFDTAYVYQNGDSERTIGEIFPRYRREDYCLATKMPGFRLESGQTYAEYRQKLVNVFDEQLRRCRVDYFDFYLFHNVCEDTIDRFIDYGTVDFLTQMQQEGKIRHLGFSSHGAPETLRRFASLRQWDFGQLQINYLDWHNQDAAQQYQILTERNIPVIVMEPVRGGRLTSLGQEADDILHRACPNRSIASWAFRFLQGLDNVQVVLSGMSSVAQLQENADLYDAPMPLSDAEKEALSQALVCYRKMNCIPCTGCRYCDGCPQQINIPDLFTAYNRAKVYYDREAEKQLSALPDTGHPGNCVGCGRCESLCPQKLEIIQLLSQIAKDYPKKT